MRRSIICRISPLPARTSQGEGEKPSFEIFVGTARAFAIVVRMKTGVLQSRDDSSDVHQTGGMNPPRPLSLSAGKHSRHHDRRPSSFGCFTVNRAHHIQWRIAALILLQSFATISEAADWPQWRGPNRDGSWNETNIMETFPASGLSFAWRVPVGRGWSSPIVAGGRVYLTDVQISGGRAVERILCLDEPSGRLLWSHTYPAAYPEWAFAPDAGGPRATPLVKDGRLFSLGAAGRLFSLDAVRGTVLWEKDLTQLYGLEAFSGITASPMIEGGLLILCPFAKPDASVVALDPGSGREIWRALNDSFSYSSPAVFSAGGNTQLVVWTQAAITSLDLATGRTWWREPCSTPGDMAVATPVFANHRLLAGGIMFQLNSNVPAASALWPEKRAATKRVWSNTSTPLFQGDHIYSARTSGELICVEAATGHVLWETNSVTSLKNGACIHLTPNGDSVFLFTDQGNLIRARLSPQGYQELGRARLLEPTHPFNGRNVVWPPPAYANRRVFARNDKELVCAELGKPSAKR